MMKKLAIALGAALLFAGCAVHVTKVPLAPPPPPPKPDPPAQIFPQTAFDLPDPQPVPPEAIPKREEPAVLPAVTEAPPAHSAPRHTAPATRHEPEPVEPPATAATTTNPLPDASKTPPRTPLVPVGPDLPKSDMIQKRLDALSGMHERLSSKKGGNAEMLRGRIRYFMDQASKALARQDLRQADALTSRAEVLSQDLLGVR